VQHDIPVTFCVINNGYLGMVRQWQSLFYDDRLSQVKLPQDLPDLLKLADAYGIPGFRVMTVEDLEPTLAKAHAITDQPVLIDFRVDPDEMVFPMVPSGASNDDILETAEQWYARAAEQAAAAAEEDAR
jgi:acetolactate synthase I/II/III large subunit